MIRIDGYTEVVGLFGYPVKHTLSPPIHNAAYQAMGLNLVYLAFEVEPKGLAEAIKAALILHWRGFNLTVPFKEEVLPYLQEITPKARAVGAVNTIEIQANRLKGYNTDGWGFFHSLKDQGVEVTGKKIVILGAGGAARAISLELAQRGAAHIVVANRTFSRARKLAEDFVLQVKDCSFKAIALEEPTLSNNIRETDILINATSVGLHPEDPLLINFDILSPPLLVCDLIYFPSETRLLRIAREKGCRTLNGQGMLVYQGARAIKIWTGKNPPLNLMHQILEEEIAKLEKKEPGDVNAGSQ